jgi:sugar/nucleoside kinase (ribokinase family)
MLQWKNSNSLSKFTKIIHTNKIQHAIYRLNAEKNYVFINNKIYKSNNKRHKTIVNSAGAGDGFNAHYIATFFKTNNVNLALQQGHNIGSKIVKHRNAIIL